MPMTPRRDNLSPNVAVGFTLIELLVVIGIIAVLAATIGISLVGDDQSVAVSSGREIVRAHLEAARSQATLHQAETLFLVAANSTDPDRNLQYVVVAVADRSGHWRIAAGGASLPGSAWVWPNERGSSLLTETVSIALEPGEGPVLWHAVRFDQTGRMVKNGGGQLWIGGGVRGEGGLSFPAETPRTGLVVSRYGAISTVDWPGGVYFE